jgi:methionine synthase II (cobalamin-independent)
MSNKKKAKPVTRPNPSRVELQPDHAKVLQDASQEEKNAYILLGQHSLRLREMEASYKKQHEELQQLLSAIEKRIKSQKVKITEIAQSFQSFYDLPPRAGHQWQLNMDEGAWIRVPTEGA